jgi:dTDP-4-dehydrorhamnose reductase
MPSCRKSGSRSERAWLSLVFREYRLSFHGTSTRPYEPDDPIGLLNLYGQSKAAREKAILEHHSDWCIARTSWLFGAAVPAFRRRFFVPPRRGPLRHASRDSIRIKPITTAEAARPAKRPAYSFLSPASLYARGLRMPDWRDALGCYLKELWKQGKLA